MSGYQSPYTGAQIDAAIAAALAPQAPADPERRFEATVPYHYIGTAPADSLESAEVWAITRLDFTTNMIEANATNVSWTDRITATYI